MAWPLDGDRSLNAEQRARLERIGGNRRVLLRCGVGGFYDPPSDEGLASAEQVFVAAGRVTLRDLLATMNGADVLRAIDRGDIATRGIYAEEMKESP